MSPEVSTKNTKNEILEAYNTLLEQIKESKKGNKQEEKEQIIKKETLSQASQHTVENIVKHLAELKVQVARTFDNLEGCLLGESKKLTTLRQAMDIATEEVEELHEIKVNADSLAALLLAQKQKTEQFEQTTKQKQEGLELEVTQKRAIWKKEQEEFESKQKEREADLKKLRSREEEDYTYQRDIGRKKEQDTYASKKFLLEKELSDKRSQFEAAYSKREADVLGRENELKDLRAQVEAHPTLLTKAVEEAKKSVTDQLKFRYDYEAKLLAKETEGERKLFQQRITDLENKAKSQEEKIKQLEERYNQAGLQVKDIAVKAIEGASRQRFFNAYSEKSETAKAAS